MKVNEKSYTLTFSEDEIHTIVDALHHDFKRAAESAAVNTAEKLRPLRNSLADLIGTRFMGADA